MTDIWIQVRRVVGGIETIREVTVTAEVARDKDLFDRVLEAAFRDDGHRNFVGFTPPVANVAAYIDTDGWIEWFGGAAPNTRGRNVEVRLRGGEVGGPRPPSTYWWGREGVERAWDIVAFRIEK